MSFLLRMEYHQIMEYHHIKSIYETVCFCSKYRLDIHITTSIQSSMNTLCNIRLLQLCGSTRLTVSSAKNRSLAGPGAKY